MSLNWFTWLTGWYLTEPRMNAMMDNDRYLRDRTDFAEVVLPPALIEGLSNSGQWDWRLTVNGTALVSWTNSGIEPNARVADDVSIVSLADGLLSCSLDARTDNGVWSTVVAWRAIKREDLGYLTLFPTTTGSGTKCTVTNATMILHREPQSW